MRVRMRLSSAATVLLGAALLEAEAPREILIDGDFGDWAGVPSHSDPAGSALHEGIPDVHDTGHDGPLDHPLRVQHPDVDLLEYKLAHDSQNLYAYFRAAGRIGNTQASGQGRSGRYYVIVTIDVDNAGDTGYWLHEGGYYPTTGGYDMNMEIEFFDGKFNTGHYLNHGATTSDELEAAFADQRQGIVRVLPGSYGFYTQWVWFDNPASGEEPLPGGNSSITFVSDRGPVVQGNIRAALSSDGHELEMVVPFVGFMNDTTGNPIVSPGITINASFSLEASGELAPDGVWASDTGDPIAGYHIGAAASQFIRGDVSASGRIELTDALQLLGILFRGLGSLNCLEAADANGDGAVDLSDVVYDILHLFAGGQQPPPPYPGCGEAENLDGLGCNSFTACSGGAR